MKLSIKGQGHSLTLVKGHSDFKVKCLTFGLYTKVSNSGPHGPLVIDTKAVFFVLDEKVFFSWLVGCLGFNGPLRQYFSLYRAVSQREGRKRKERIDENKNVQTSPTCTYCKCSRPLPYCNPNCKTPRHWKFTQHHRITRPPPSSFVKPYRQRSQKYVLHLCLF